MIEVKNLRKSFGELEVLKGIDKKIEQGEKVVIIGPSGSGKSTFLRCLNLLEEPTGGDVFIDGECITDKNVNINVIREKMGMVFQQFNLFPHLSVLDNITLAPIKVKNTDKTAAEAKARELLQRVGLDDKADSFPAQLSLINILFFWRNNNVQENPFHRTCGAYACRTLHGIRFVLQERRCFQDRRHPSARREIHL